MMNLKNPVWKYISIISMSFFLLLIQGCDSTENTDGSVSVSFSTPDLSRKISDDTIVIDTVKILLRNVKLENESDENDSEHNEHSDEVNIKIGPFVVYLNLNGVTTDFVVSNIPPGSYNQIKFEIHKIEASETPPDPEFKDGDDSSLRYSVIVKGVYNSNPFIYKSSKSAHQIIRLETPLLIEPNTLTNLTLQVDPSTWFVKNDLILDPTNPANENDIDNNIKDSFKRCFRDDNHIGGND
jgi:hypothetical protein